MKYAAAYIRVSDDRQDEYSPDSQLKLIREYAGRNGYCVPDGNSAGLLATRKKASYISPCCGASACR